VRRIEKIHKSWDLAAQRKDGTSDDLDGSVSFGSILTTNMKKLRQISKINPVER
jgi:hypothetical protein